MTKEKIRMMTEGGIMVALAFILSFFKVIEMPFGGSLTACSMVPIILIAYRYGHKLSWGVLVAFLYSLLQLLMDFGEMRKAVDWKSLIAVFVLDYILAFTALGVGGVFKKIVKAQDSGLMAGAGLACLLRYVCHVIAGCTVWAGVSVPTADGFWYSLLYNAAFMVPETILTLGVCFYIGKMLNLDTLKGVRQEPKSMAVMAIGWFLGIFAVIFDAIYLFVQMQTEDGFDITRVSMNDALICLGILLGAAIILAIMALIQRKRK